MQRQMMQHHGTAGSFKVFLTCLHLWSSGSCLTWASVMSYWRWIVSLDHLSICLTRRKPAERIYYLKSFQAIGSVPSSPFHPLIPLVSLPCCHTIASNL